MTVGSSRGAARDLALALGDFCFRRRSWLPLLFLPVLVLAIVRFQRRFGSHASDLTWEAGCLTFAALGLALRVWTVGTAAPGTSGRNTRKQKAAVLNTTGPYSLVRHPLYVANAVIGLGLTLFPHAWLAPVALWVVGVGYYGLIGWREERFLGERFGRLHAAWAARTPAVVPVPWRWAPPARAFDWRVAARREFYAAALLLVAPLPLDVLEDWHYHGRFELDPVWTVTALVGAALFAGGRYVKKRTTWLR